MTTPAPSPAAAPVSDGKTLGIVGLVLAFLIPLAGLIVSIVARGQSKKAGVPNTPAKVGLILSIIFMILGLIFTIVFVAGGATLFGGIAAACAELGPGVHEVGGVTYTCG